MDERPAIPAPDRPVTTIEPPESPLTQEIMPRKVKYFLLAEREMSTLGVVSAGGALLAVFLGLAIGASISLGTTLSTVDIPAGKIYMAYWAAFLVSVFSSLVLLVFTLGAFVWAFLDVRGIKKESEQRKRQLEFKGDEPS